MPAEPGWSRIWIYHTQTGAWSHISYALEPKPPNAAWAGLSEITRVDDGWMLIERDNLTRDFGLLETLVELPLDPGVASLFTRGEKACSTCVRH